MTTALDYLQVNIQKAMKGMDELSACMGELPSHMRTFSLAEVNMVLRKLMTAESLVEEAAATDDTEVAKLKLKKASIPLGSAIIYLTSEYAQFQVALTQATDDAKVKEELKQYDEKVRRNHEKFMIVANTLLAIIQRIPSAAL